MLDGGAFAFLESASERTALFPIPAANPKLCHGEGVSTPTIGAGRTKDG